MAVNKAITIGETTVKPGERASISLPVADMYTGASLSMPVKVICGRREGPVLFVSAAIHGDELNGVEIIRRLLKRRTLQSLRGTLVAVPVVNVHGFLDLSRYLPDRRDLNRSFPGSSKGSIAARMANIFITQIVSKADYGIDLHTGALNRSNLPQIRANLDNEVTKELARAFGAAVVLDSKIRDGSLRACAADRGFPMLIYEAGEALRFDEVAIRAGLRGVIQVMRHLGMLPQIKKKTTMNPVIADSTRWVRAPASGIVSSKVALGTRVREGQRLAIIGDPLGEAETHVVAPFDGIVIGRNNLPLSHEGDALFNVAAFESISRAEDKVEQFVATHTE
ncbi:succinylglutamate desuccinylase [Gammaproteobacteria bacterium]|jgi:predicted deacylase|nr:succinylglutamate desuccinylase [Gammaproteobacteria bacterium]